MANELYHIGRSKRDGAKIGSGRFRLGSGERPFQMLGGKSSRKLKKEAAKAAKENEKAKKQLTPDEINAIREKVTRPPIDLKEVQKNRDYLTTEDLNKIKNRIEAEKNISRLYGDQINAGKKFVQAADKTQQTIERLLKYYGTMRKVAAFFDEINGGKKQDISFYTGGNKKKK